MRKLRSALCLLCLMLLIPVLSLSRRILPLDTHPLVEEKYAGWSGVLNLWIYEGWPCGGGSLSSWLNPCILAFEKAHPGVYVQPQFVDAGAITTINESGILPPDMLLFPPNLLATPEGLMSLAAPHELRPALRHCGEWNGITHAVPVAMGGYLWAWNIGLIDAIPDSWRNADAVLSVPAPQSWRRWDTALLALCSGRYTPPDPNAAPNSTPSVVGEVDLGLSVDSTLVPTPSPEPRQGAMLSRHLPAGFRYDEDAWRHFINGESTAMPVTQREIRRLQSLLEQGKGPQWQLGPGDNAFTDQLLALAIVDLTENADRKKLCADFLAWLLSDACQSTLYRASIFGVTDAPSGYGPSDPLVVMDRALRDPGLSVPGIFDGQWVSGAEAIVRKFISDSEDAPTLWTQLRRLLKKNSND